MPFRFKSMTEKDCTISCGLHAVRHEMAGLKVFAPLEALQSLALLVNAKGFLEVRLRIHESEEVLNSQVGSVILDDLVTQVRGARIVKDRLDGSVLWMVNLGRWKRSLSNSMPREN